MENYPTMSLKGEHNIQPHVGEKCHLRSQDDSFLLLLVILVFGVFEVLLREIVLPNKLNCHYLHTLMLFQTYVGFYVTHKRIFKLRFSI